MARQPKPVEIARAEREVCERLARARRDEGFSLATMAAILGVPSRSTVKNYEYGGAHLPATTGFNFCSHLNFSLRWLATGSGPQRPFSLPEDAEGSTKAFLSFGGTFLQAYNHLLKDRFDVWEGSEGQAAAIREPDFYFRFCSDRILRRRGWELLRRIIEAASIEEVEWRHKELSRLVDELSRRAARKLGFALDALGSYKTHLAAVTEIPSWPELQTLLVGEAKSRGQKAAMARFLGSSRSEVSKFLRGLRTPSAGDALLLLKWVRLQKTNKRSPEGAGTPSRPKTRKRKSDHEKPSSGPPGP